MQPDDHRPASEADGAEDQGQEASSRARLRTLLLTLTFVAVVTLIVIGVVRIVQS